MISVSPEDAASDETILVGTAGGQSEPRNPAASTDTNRNRLIDYMSFQC